jgi:hypothetical protein
LHTGKIWLVFNGRFGAVQLMEHFGMVQDQSSTSKLLLKKNGREACKGYRSSSAHHRNSKCPASKKHAACKTHAGKNKVQLQLHPGTNYTYMMMATSDKCMHVTLIIESRLWCEDNLVPQLDQGNEKVIRVALLTFGLKR